MEKTLAIYLGTKYVVREYDESRTGLCVVLGPDYDRSKAATLADSLNRERDEAKTIRRKELQK